MEEVNDERLQGYNKVKIVGKGAFGTAVLYEHDNNYVVIKEIQMLEMISTEKMMALNEVRILASLHHPNIIRYLDSFQMNGSLMIEMEYADGGTLSQYLDSRAQQGRPLTELFALKIFNQIVSAIAYMHGNNILHRDLKTANVFLNKNGTVKVGDFGISKMMMTRAQAQTVVGTPYYLSPEICEGKEYGEKSDVWALGCILYELLRLKKPFEGDNLPSLVTRILRGNFEKIPQGYSMKVKELVEIILQRDPYHRPSAGYIEGTILPPIIEVLKTQRKSEKMQLYFKDNAGSLERSILYEVILCKDDVDLSPIQLPPKKILDVAIGKSHSIVILSDYSVYVWGSNRFGELGFSSSANEIGHPTNVEYLRNKKIIRACVGDGFTILLSEEGVVYSCGQGETGCLGGSDLETLYEPQKIGKLSHVDIVQIDTGQNHVLALSKDGILYAWGDGKYGKLGLHSENSCLVPTVVNVPSDNRIVSIHCGNDCSAVITEDRKIFVCGSNANNKLGTNSLWYKTEKVLSFSQTNIYPKDPFKVSFGEDHIAIISTSGILATAGLVKPSRFLGSSVRTTRKFQGRPMAVSCGGRFVIVGTDLNVVYFLGSQQIERNISNKNTITSRTVQVSVNKTNFMLQNSKIPLINLKSTSEEVSDVVTIPKPILALYTSPELLSQKKMIWLSDIKCCGSDIYILVHTTVPVPVLAESIRFEMTDDEEDDS